VAGLQERPPREIYLDPENLAYRRAALLEDRCLRCPPYTRTRWEIEKDLPRMVAASLRRLALSAGRRRR